MSLLGVLNIGGSALAAQTAALQVTGNNLANAANPNYTREVVEYTPSPDVQSQGGFLGSGVSVGSIQRQVDTSLQQRLLGANSDNSSATTLQSFAGQVQSIFNALSPNGTSTQISKFFSDWSTFAAAPTGTGNAQLVINDGQQLATSMNTLSSNLTALTTGVQQNVSQAVTQINTLTSQIAGLNQQIVAASDGGSQQPNSLLDQRDADLSSLSQLANITSVVQPTGSVNVYIGSAQLVQDTSAQTLTANTNTVNGQLVTTVNFQSSGAVANITGGQISGALQAQTLVNNSLDSVNTLAQNVISAVNNVHASGQGSSGYTTITSTNPVSDPTAALSTAAAGLPFPVKTGSFFINVTNNNTTPPTTTGTQVSITENGGSGDTTLNSLATTLNGISGVSASISNGQLTIQSTLPKSQISFGGDTTTDGTTTTVSDTSGILSALGINTFFSGTNAATISLNSQVANTNNTGTLAVSAGGLGNGDVQTATNIANLDNVAQPGLSNNTISQYYDNLIQTVGTAAASATNNAASAASVQQTLQGQQQALGGVSTDEEALNMIVEQRSYQGAAQLISTINQMMQTLLNITIA